MHHESKPRAGRIRQHIGLIGTLLALGVCGIVRAGEEPAASGHPGASNQQLVLAVQQGDPALLKVAFDAGADANCRDTNGVAPLLHLLRAAPTPLTEPQRACCSLLLKHGADPNAQDGDRRTLLIHAARIGDLETVRLLVEADAYVRTRDRFHKTALMYAVEAHRRDIVAYLAENGDLQTLPYREKQLLKKGHK